MRYKSGDIIKVIKPHCGWEPYSAGDVFTVKDVDIDETGNHDYDLISIREHGDDYMMYASEVEHYATPPKDYDEDAEYAAKDADVSTWVKEEEIDEYNEIVIGLSQAIAMKAAQMRGEDSPRLMGEHVGFGCETPTVDMPEDDDSDAAIYKELRGHGSSEANGILQAGISTEQALAARDRALAKKRKEDVEKAKKALEVAQARYDEVVGKEADGDIPKASMTIQLDGKDIAESLFSYGKIPGHPHAITLNEPLSAGTLMYNGEEVTKDTIKPHMFGGHGKPTPGKRAPDYNAGDSEWDAMEPVGKEIIYDAYNPDVVKAPAHYVGTGIEPIQYMADKLPSYDDGHTAFCVGNVIKYVSRAPHKGNLLQDLKKARQYLDFAIEHEEKKQN